VEIIPIWISLKPEYLQALVTKDVGSSADLHDESPSMGNNITDSVRTALIWLGYGIHSPCCIFTGHSLP
jgi:hypothetical protein